LSGLTRAGPANPRRSTTLPRRSDQREAFAARGVGHKISICGPKRAAGSHGCPPSLSGPKKFGAVVYVKPGNGGLTLRLRPDDVDDLDDKRIRLRNVAPTQPYAVNCPLNDNEAVDLAVDLTERALRKVRGR